MKRLAITYLSVAAVLTAGVVGCKMRQTPKQPAAGDAFVAQVVNELGKNGQACFDRGEQELCIAKGVRPISSTDKLEPDEQLVLCTRTAGQLSDCRDVRSEPDLGVEYVCDEGVCYCEGVANCTLMAADCAGGGICGGECAVGDCCCPETSVNLPQMP
ncbi:MAG TPA: hypothetical protein VM869_36160 [Enhygromyxa sp.]|nr:hypothetical protein [Enhygromyxa sp.]